MGLMAALILTGCRDSQSDSGVDTAVPVISTETDLHLDGRVRGTTAHYRTS